VAWFTGARPDNASPNAIDKARTSMRQSGAPDSVIEAHVAALAARPAAATEGLWPQHVPPLQAFHACDTQWRMAGSLAGTIVVGLDYAACDVSLRHFGIDLTAEGWRDFRTLENAAVKLMNGTKPEVLLA
jgi:hypothetical protein